MRKCFKGNTKTFRSISQNVLIITNKYEFSNGYFGTKSPDKHERNRNIFSKNILETAYDFYNKIALGGVEEVRNSNLRITKMADGSIITLREKSTSDGTPAININIKLSNDTGGIKLQKIHFVSKVKS